MKKAFTSIVIMIFSVVVMGQTEQIQSEELQSLLQADRDFAHAAHICDLEKVFDFWTSDGKMLMIGERILRGRDQIIAFVKRSRQDPNFAIDWEVEGGEVAQSGDMGYTFGIGHVTLSDSAGNPLKHTNPYLVVWKKSADGKWRSAIEK